MRPPAVIDGVVKMGGGYQEPTTIEKPSVALDGLYIYGTSQRYPPEHLHMRLPCRECARHNIDVYFEAQEFCDHLSVHGLELDQYISRNWHLAETWSIPEYRYAQ